MITRRELLIMLGASVLAAPLASFAQQQGKVWRVGSLGTGSRHTASSQVSVFLIIMRDLGYVEGKNLIIEWRWAEGKYDRLPAFAAELVEKKVDVILASGSPAIRAAQQATSTIPIVMGTTGDPVGSGFVTNLARPGGNITGFSNYGGDLSAKHLEMLMSVVPRLSRLGLLRNPGSSTYSRVLLNVEAAARKTGITLVRADARSPEELERGFALMTRERVGAVIIGVDPFFTEQVEQLAQLSLKYRLPGIYMERRYPESGGLMSYGVDSNENYRRAAVYVDKILKGAKPGDLPVEQPMRFELVINGKTAKALGLTIPPSLLISVEKVIE